MGVAPHRITSTSTRRFQAHIFLLVLKESMMKFRPLLKPLHVRWADKSRPRCLTEHDLQIPHQIPEALVLLVRQFKNPLAIQLYCEIDRACREEMLREMYPNCSLTAQELARLLGCSDRKIIKAFQFLAEHEFIVGLGLGNHTYTTSRYQNEKWYPEVCFVPLEKKKRGTPRA